MDTHILTTPPTNYNPAARLVRSAHAAAEGIALLTRPYLFDSRGAKIVASETTPASAINALLRHAAVAEGEEAQGGTA